MQVGGEVLNPYIFEFGQAEISGDRLLAVARPRPAATHLSIVRKVGAERRSEYYPQSAAAQVTIRDGDEVTLTSDKYPGTILVRIEGAHLGERTLVLPYGAQLKDAQALAASDPRILESEIGPDGIRLYVSADHHGNWLECIRTRQQTIAPVEIAHRACTACLLHHIAMKVPRRLHWDPVHERFQNDDEANAMLTRPQRAPYGLPT